MPSLWQRWYDLVVATNDGYPDLIHFPHTLLCVSTYRAWRQAEGQPNNWLYDLIASYWCHSQGGGAMCKGMLAGHQQMSWLTNTKHPEFHILGYLMIYWSPRNVVYKIVSQPRSPARLFCIAMDSLDTYTTVCQLMDYAKKLFPQNRILPVIASVVVFHAGSVFRWADAKGRGVPVKTFIAAPGSSFTKAVVFAFIWLVLGRGRTRDRNLVALCSALTLLDVVNEVYPIGDPLTSAHKLPAAILQFFQRHLELGGDLEKEKGKSTAEGQQ